MSTLGSPPTCSGYGARANRDDRDNVQLLTREPRPRTDAATPDGDLDEIFVKTLEMLSRTSEGIEILAERKASVVFADPDMLLAVELQKTQGGLRSFAQIQDW